MNLQTRFFLTPLKFQEKTEMRRAAGTLPSDLDQARVGGALCSTHASNSCQYLLKGPDTGPSTCQDCGNGRGL